MRTCKSCGRTLPLTDEFFYRQGNPKYFYHDCKKCFSAKNHANAREIASRPETRIYAQKVVSEIEILKLSGVGVTVCTIAADIILGEDYAA